MTTTCDRCGLFHPASMPCAAQVALIAGRRDRLVEGTVLAGRYRIKRVIHNGGMSVVYLAIDALMQDRPVVLKQLYLPSTTSLRERREAEAWFAREAYILSSVSSPLIPEFYSSFSEGGTSYIVQEYVAGENLNDVIIARGPVDEGIVTSWALALSGLLSYLHGLDEPVLFRDLKPANILLRDGPGGIADDAIPIKVVDFGIARRYEPGVVGTVIGTPGYAPPEQYQGLATPQSDVYALGATMHRLLTGYDPEHGTPFNFPSAISLNPLLSPEISAIVERALRLDPARRFDSAAEMGDALFQLIWREPHAGTTQSDACDYAGGMARGSTRAQRTFRWTALVVCVMMVAPGLLTLVSGIGAHYDAQSNPLPTQSLATAVVPAITIPNILDRQSFPGNCVGFGTSGSRESTTNLEFGNCSGRSTVSVEIRPGGDDSATFSSRIINISRGQAVRFEWETSGCRVLPWDDEIGFAGEYFELSFDEPGNYRFACGSPSGISGVVRVR